MNKRTYVKLRWQEIAVYAALKVRNHWVPAKDIGKWTPKLTAAAAARAMRKLHRCGVLRRRSVTLHYYRLAASPEKRGRYYRRRLQQATCAIRGAGKPQSRVFEREALPAEITVQQAAKLLNMSVATVGALCLRKVIAWRALTDRPRSKRMLNTASVLAYRRRLATQ